MDMLFSFFLSLENNNGLMRTDKGTARGIPPQSGKGGMDPATARRMTRQNRSLRHWVVILREVAGSMDMLFSFFLLHENDNGLRETDEATTRHFT
jgi:hypothetical protein